MGFEKSCLQGDQGISGAVRLVEPIATELLHQIEKGDGFGLLDTITDTALDKALAQRLRLSPLVGYLLAGVMAGPFTPGFVADQHLAEQLAEVGIILGLADKLGWSKQPDRLRGWLRSRWEAELPGWLNSYQARECIEAMKAMLKGGRGERKEYQEA